MSRLCRSMNPFVASMKTELPALYFFIFALVFFAECAEARTSTQDRGKIATVSTLAGSGSYGYSDGIGIAARFDEPFDVAIDKAGNLYVADADNHRIRKVTPKGEVSTLAGSGRSGHADGVGGAAQFRNPWGITIDAAGNLYVADAGNHRIRKVTPKGEVSTLAGGGRDYDSPDYVDGVGSAARFLLPSGIAIDRVGNLYVADTGNNRIRKVTPKGEVSTLAGSDHQGYADGIGNAAQFNSPLGIAIDAAGNLYVADTENQRIRKVTPKGEVSTLAGGDSNGYVDGPGNVARFAYPSGIAIDRAGNLYVADSYKGQIRKVTPRGEVSTLTYGHTGIAGCASPQFERPRGITIDAAGNLYVADTHNHRIRKIVFERASRDRGATVSTLAGSGNAGHVDGIGSVAQFSNPFGTTIDAAGNLYVTDLENHRIRKVTPQGVVSTLAGSATTGDAEGIGNDAQFREPIGIALDRAGNFYVSDAGNHRIHKVTPQGEVGAFVGGTRGVAEGIGNAAQFNSPAGIAIDAAGNLYVAEYGSERIRKVTPNGEVSTFAGSGAPGDADGVGISAQFKSPSGIVMDKAGNLYVVDTGNARIRKITPKGEVSTLAGSTRGFADGVGISAQFGFPLGIAIDTAGNLYVVDTGNIRKVTPKGEVSTLAGSAYAHADGTGCDERSPTSFGIAIDAAGNLYVTDTSNHRIRKIVIK